jgi:hypothetical protein
MNELFENTQEIEIWAQWCASIALFRMYRDSTDDLEKGQHRDIFLVGGMGGIDILKRQTRETKSTRFQPSQQISRHMNFSQTINCH